MKYSIIGWTEYDDESFPTAQVSYAIKHAVIDDIKEHGYCFTGYHHQEFEKCAPVLNTGEKVLFSQRGFGDVMATAHGMDGLYDYSLFTYPPDAFDKRFVLPTVEVQSSEIQDKKELVEMFSASLDMEAYARADIDRVLELTDSDEYRFIENGDVIRLVCGENDSEYYVTSVERKKDVSYTLEYKFKYRDCNLFEGEKEQIIKDYLTAGNKVILKLEYKFRLRG